ncbi:MAG: TetR/AcrR family transcriptional regulator [Blastocatellia bacterium]
MTQTAKSTYRKFSGIGEDDRLFLIYRTAARVIHEKGYDATSLNEIADAVGITKGGLYHYIDGKKSLLFKIMSYALDLLEARVIKPSAEFPDAEQRLRSAIALHAKLIIDEGIEMTILLDESAGLTAEDLRRITKRRMAYYKFIRAILQQLKDEGKLHNLDVTIATHNLIGQLQWLARWYRPEGRLTREEVITEFTKAALTALLRPRARPVVRKLPAPGNTKANQSKTLSRRRR